MTALAALAVRVALADSDPRPLRSSAADLVRAAGAEADRRALTPLFVSPPVEDEDDDLKGYAWRVLADPFACDALRAPDSTQAPEPVGRIGVALDRITETLNGDRLEKGYLLPGLQWVRRRRGGNTPSESRLADLLLTRALMEVTRSDGDPAAVQELTTFLNQVAEHYDSVPGTADYEPHGFRDALSGEPEARRTLVQTLISSGGEKADKLAFWIAYHGQPLFLLSDLPWVLEQLSVSRLGTRAATLGAACFRGTLIRVIWSRQRWR